MHDDVPSSGHPNPYHMAVAQFEAAADRLDLSSDLRAILRAPKRELTVHFPVRMDDGSIRMFTGYRVQHNINRGPAKGGIRYDAQCLARRGEGAGDVDDVEMRRGGHPVRRRQRRRHRRSEAAEHAPSWSA